MYEIKFDFETENGWVKMPLEAVMYNERLTGQARQLWAWLVSKKRYQDEMSWSHAEFKLRCGPSARRRSMQILVEEGFVSVSRDGRIITMHDPEDLLQKTKQQHNEFARNEFFRSAGIPDPKKKPDTKPVKASTDEKKEIIDAWNACKPDSYAKIRVLSNKQKECVNKHLSNLGLKKTEIKELICSVCRGLAQDTFWSKQIDVKSRNFNAVFGYGSPNDKKMKNIENLYLLGDPENVQVDETKPIQYTNEQEETIDLIAKLDYQISMQDPRDLERDYVQRFFKMREEAKQKLVDLGIDPESL